MIVKLALFAPTALQPDKLSIKNSKIGVLANSFFILLSSDRDFSKKAVYLENSYTFFKKNTLSHTFSMGTNGIGILIIIMQEYKRKV